jgi:hypothetical protein
MNKFIIINLPLFYNSMKFVWKADKQLVSLWYKINPFIHVTNQIHFCCFPDGDFTCQQYKINAR